MSQTTAEQTTRKSAELLYREAFERLKNGTTIRLPVGAAVSQNNVAKEAGTDPSALRKSRFPTLISEIQLFIVAIGPGAPSARQKILSQRKNNRDLQQRLNDTLMQRDKLCNMLNLANAKIVALTEKITELEEKILPHDVNLPHPSEGKVIDFAPRDEPPVQ